MAVDILYEGLDLFNIVKRNKNVSISYDNSTNEIIVTTLDSARGANTSPGFRIDGIQVQQNHVYRVVIVGRTITAARPYLWVAKNTGSPNLVDSSIALGATTSTIYADFAFTDPVSVPAGIDSVFIGILMRQSSMGEQFAISSVIMQTLSVDYITPYQQVKVNPVFESLIISSDINIGGEMVSGSDFSASLVSDLMVLAEITEIDAVLISDISAIIATDVRLNSDVGYIYSIDAQLQSDVAMLRTTDNSISSDLFAFRTTDTYISSLLTLLNGILQSDLSVSDFSATYILAAVSDLRTSVTELINTDIYILDYINALIATDISISSDTSALIATDTAINVRINGLRTTDGYMTSELSLLVASGNALINGFAGISSDIFALTVTDASILIVLNSDILAFRATDADLLDQLPVLYETDGSFASDIAALILSDAAHISDLAEIMTTDTYIQSILSSSSDMIALKTTDAHLISLVNSLVTSDIILGTLVIATVNSDANLVSRYNGFISDINALITTDISQAAQVTTLNSELAAIWTTDLAMIQRVNAHVSDIFSTQTSDLAMIAQFNGVTSDISAIKATDISLTSDVFGLILTNNSFISDISAVWTTDIVFFSDLVAIWTTDLYLLGQITGTGTSSDRAALITTDAALAVSLSGILNSDSAMVSDITAILTTESSYSLGVATVSSDFLWSAGQVSARNYDSNATYTTGNLVWYNGHIFEAISDTTGVAPVDYLFYDNFSGLCDSSPLFGDMTGYQTSDNFINTFTSSGLTVSSSGSNAVILAPPVPNYFTIELGTSTMYVDLEFSNLPVYTSDQPWFGISTTGGGVLSFQSGNNVASVGPTSIFTIGLIGGSLPGGVTAAAAISGNSYTPPVSGNTLRIGRVDGHTVTLQVGSDGAFNGGLATLTISSDVLTSASTNFSVGLGYIYSSTLSSISSYVNATSETSKPWTIMNQTPSRSLVATNALTLNARFGRFFWSPGSISANATSTVMTWTNSHINPQSYIYVDVVQWGVSSPVSAASLSINVYAVGQGRASLQILNGGSLAVTPFATVVFRIYYPISLT